MVGLEILIRWPPSILCSPSFEVATLNVHASVVCRREDTGCVGVGAVEGSLNLSSHVGISTPTLSCSRMSLLRAFVRGSSAMTCGRSGNKGHLDKAIHPASQQS